MNLWGGYRQNLALFNINPPLPKGCHKSNQRPYSRTDVVALSISPILELQLKGHSFSDM